MKIIIAAVHEWNKIRVDEFKNTYKEWDVWHISSIDEFDIKKIYEYNPDYIMCAHWSWIIPSEIFEKFECIVFHVSDVPNGRGGSPVQNQIADGLDKTRISAIRVDAGLDTGDVYIKRELSLEGSAEEIFIRSSKIVFEDMIPYIIENKPNPIKQSAGGFTYKRRKEEQSCLPSVGSLKDAFDHIRMLDAPGYPHSYIIWGDYKLTFSRAKLESKDILADVKIERL